MLNRLPAVKAFLKGGLAESYEGVTVEYIKGRKPVLTIYEDGTKREEVQLMQYTSVDQLHALFKEKGFHQNGGESGKQIAAESKKSVQRKELQSSNLLAEEEYFDPDKNVIVQGFGYMTGASIVLMAVAYGMKMRKVKTRSV